MISTIRILPRFHNLISRLSMKIVLSIFLWVTGCQLNAQGKVVGYYRNYFGGNLDLYADSTFHYFWRFDLMGSWTNGIWKTNNDTIYLAMIPVYDTLTYLNKNNKFTDSLLLALDEKPRRISMEEAAKEAIILYSGHQNMEPYPTRLLYRKNRLYQIDNNQKLSKKWEKGFSTGKKFPPWFERTSSSH